MPRPTRHSKQAAAHPAEANARSCDVPLLQVYGPEASGKTTLALHAIAEAQKLGGDCLFIDAEHAFDAAYAKVTSVVWHITSKQQVLVTGSVVFALGVAHCQRALCTAPCLTVAWAPYASVQCGA